MINALRFWNNLGHNFKRIYIPAHILFVIGIITFFTGDSSLWWLLAIYPSWFITGHIGFGIFLHKYYCHKSFKTYDWIARTGAFFGMLCGTGSPVMLKAVHIGQHHPNTDTEKDPHTPKKGFWWSYFLWLNYKWDFKKLWIIKDIMKDPYIRFYHKHYYKIYWGSWALLALIDWRLAVFTITAATILEFHLAGLINTVGHTKTKSSYKNYSKEECDDLSQNITWLNWLTLGLGLHNNHHAEPWNYNYARKDRNSKEFDFAQWFVPLIEKR